jgi:ATP-dependent Clp protease ATP-binding subunit ClpA
MINELDQFPLDSSVMQLFSRMENLVFQRQHTTVISAHLARCAADVDAFGRALLGSAHHREKIQELTRRANARLDAISAERVSTDLSLDEALCGILQKALLEAQHFGAAKINIDHLVLAVLHTDDFCDELLPLDERQWRQADADARQRLRSRRTSVVTHTPTLDQHSDDLSKRVRDGNIAWPVVGRNDELLQVQRILLRRTKRNPLLVGPAGAGKTTLLTGLAASLRESPALGNYRVVELDLASLVAGTIYRGELEARIKRMLRELSDNPSVLLAIDELHLLQSGGSETSANCAEFFKPALASGDFCVIGATCPEQLPVLFRDSAIQRRFEPVFVEPLEGPVVRQVLRCVATSLQGHYHALLAVDIDVPNDVLEAIPPLAAETVPERAEPDASITLLQDAIAASLVPSSEPLDFSAERQVQVKLDTVERVAASVARTMGRLQRALQTARSSFDRLEPGPKRVRADVPTRYPANS